MTTVNFPIKSKKPNFGPFLWQRYYFQKIQLYHAQHHMGPLTPCSVLKKADEPIPGKL